MTYKSENEVLTNYQFAFELCAKVDDAIDACLLKIKAALDEVDNYT